MFVRRLVSRLSRVISTNPSSGRTTSPQRAALAVSPPSTSVAMAAMRIHNWLEDGKRLRPVRTMLAAPAQRQGDMAASLAEALPRERVVSGWTRAAGEANTPQTPLMPTISPTISPELPALGALPLAEMPPAAELTSAEAILDAAEGMDGVSRRLMFVRYLVRQRVYNEGFSMEELPEQYRWDNAMEDLGEN